MAQKNVYGSVKRFGARYGRRLREKLGKIEQEQHKLHRCPYCQFVKAKRVSVGIWECRKCESKFTNKAYTVGKLNPIKIVVQTEQH